MQNPSRICFFIVGVGGNNSTANHAVHIVVEDEEIEYEQIGHKENGHEQIGNWELCVFGTDGRRLSTRTEEAHQNLVETVLERR